MKLGDNLKELLEQHDMTQKQLALELDITPAALGNYIRNIREPDYITLIRIADYFHVSTDFLLSHKNNSPITSDEEMLLRVFRSLSADQKEIFIEQGKVFTRQNNKKLLTNT
ncbi:MAG: helix-turn-helix transcriptional regulator [Roseburia sp.]|nr:helix-turn-helix transcriptional regulator [Roseburia sp.]